jgi:MFS family permease
VLGTYLLGSGICGGASSEAMLIAGRAVQGIGSGGLNMAADVIVSDLVPLRYRGNYISMLLLISAVGFAIGPFVGGAIVENTTWRWVRIAGHC